MLTSIAALAIIAAVAGEAKHLEVRTPAFQQDASAGTSEKKPKKPKKADRAPKAATATTAKKAKKTAKANIDKPAPDEEFDAVSELDATNAPIAAPPIAVVPPATGGPLRFEWEQHPSMRIGKAVRLDFEARFQEDWHASHPFAPGLECTGEALPRTCDWQLHRNRIGVSGKVGKHIDFVVERELTEHELTEKQLFEGETPKPQWKDVNVNLDYMKNAQIQVGKFKIPFGLDELTGVTHNDFVYRSLGANYLAPGADVGGQIHGRFFKRGLNYWVGAFQHDGDNARSKKIEGGNQTFAARVSGQPFRRVLAPGLGRIDLGGAFAISELSDDSNRPNGFRGRTVMAQDYFYESVYVKGTRRRFEGDFDWTVGPASLRAEYTHVLDGRLGQGLGDEDLPDARARSWYVSGTWALTGENKARPFKAAHEFLGGGIGGIEVAARYEGIRFDSAGGAGLPDRTPRAEVIQASGNRVLTLGMNWTLNRFWKLQLNVIREHLDDPFINPVPGQDAFWSRVLRFQLVL